MDADLYQQAALRTAGDHDLELYASLGLAGEAGEVANLTKKYRYHGHPYAPEKFLDELSDCAWYIAVLSHAHGYKLSEVFQFNIDKLKKRYPEGFSMEKSINRGT